MLRAGFLVVLTAPCLASGQGLTVNNVRSILKNASLPDFKSNGTDVFHRALIEIVLGSSDELLSILNKHGARVKGLLVSGEVSVKSRHIFFMTGNTLNGSVHTAPAIRILRNHSDSMHTAQLVGHCIP